MSVIQLPGAVAELGTSLAQVNVKDLKKLMLAAARK